MSREKAEFSLTEKLTHQRFDSASVVVDVFRLATNFKNNEVGNSIWKLCD